MTDLYRACGFYQYSPLSSEMSIRLLELYPGHGNDNLECTLHHTELEKAPKYETISYAWGNPANKSNVLCDGKIIIVTQNLKEALLRLRLKDRSRVIWADAICINQIDIVEKGSQVRVMKRIYDEATRVCVWLGYTTAQVQPAVELIDEIVNHASSRNTRTYPKPDKTGPFFDIVKLHRQN